MPGYVRRALSATGASIHRYGLIRDGDSVLVGLSGGKDSLALLLLLELRRRRVRDVYGLRAIRVAWETDASGAGDDDLAAFADYLGVPFAVERRPEPVAFAARGPSCYACARDRRRVLLEVAERESCSVVALGHHLDDLAETALMNLSKHGRLETMRPAAIYFDRFRVARPLSGVRESALGTLAARLGLPVSPPSCPLAGETERRRYKAVLAELAKIDTLVRENVARAAMEARDGNT